MRQEYSPEDMAAARDLALDVLLQAPPGHISGIEELKKIFKVASRNHQFQTDDMARKRKQFAWILVSSVFQNYDVLHTEILAYLGQDEIGRHENDEALLLLGLCAISYFNFDIRVTIASLVFLCKDREHRKFIKSAMWRIAYGRVNDAAFLALQNMPSYGVNKSRDMAIASAMETVGLDECDARRNVALAIAEGVADNYSMLEDALKRYLARANCENINPEGLIILGIGLYEMLSGMGNAHDIIYSLGLLAVKYKSPEARNFLNTWLVISARSRGRAIAFQIIYALLFTPVESVKELENVYSRSPDILETSRSSNSREPRSFAWRLTRGVWSNEKSLDEVIARYSRSWRKERIGNMELTLLRLGLYEILAGLTPPKVVIMEILDLAEMFGVPDAKAFINGILNAAAKELQSGDADN